MKKRISNFCTKIKENGSKFYAFAKKNTLSTIATVAAIIPAGVVDVIAANEVDEKGLMNKVLDIIFKIFRYIGILLFVWSVGMLVLAFKNEDADSKSRAMMMMVVSVVLVAIKSVVDATGITKNI